MKRILLPFLIILSSCTAKKNIAGLYGKCDKEYFACTQMLLNDDHTFEYFIFMDVGGGSVLKGNWKRITNDSIVLNTFEQPNILKSVYAGKMHPSKKGRVKLIVKDDTGPISYGSVSINNDHPKALNEQGEAEFDKTDVKTVSYWFLGKITTLKIDKPDYDEIQITVREPFSELLLTDEVALVKRNKLIFPVGNLTYHEFELKKTNVKNKQWQ